MTSSDDFTANDWQRIRNAPWVVAIAVVAADPGSDLATSRELDMLRRLVAATDAHGSSNDLIRAVADDLMSDRVSGEPNPAASLSGFDSIRDGAVDHCRSMAALLDEVAEPDEAAEFRAWLLELARGVAEASKEGGFLGIGGTQVSEAETAVLDELAEALGVES